MIKRKIITAALVAMGVFLSFEYTSVAQQNRPATQQKQTTLSALDRQFIIEAAQGGLAEVSLGQLATQRATNATVRQFGQRMVAEHTRANQELVRLAAQKGVVPPQNLGKYTAVTQRLSQLSGDSFDRAYLNEAGINAHMESEVVYRRQVQLGQDRDLQAFAAKTLPVVQMHLQMAQNLERNPTGERQNRQTP